MNLNKKHLAKTFWALVIVFIIIVSYFFIPYLHELKRAFLPYMAIIGIIFFILGGILIYLTYKLKIKGKQKLFLILTGATPIAFLVSVILHNLVYALMIVLLGENFWGVGGDEVFFFTLGLVVCPIIFLVSVVWSIVLMYRKGMN